MNKLKKHLWEIIVALAIIASYFFLRLNDIISLPIFTDEAIYVRWAQVALNDSSWRFISLTDGKQPLFIWATIAFMKFVNDPLLAARLVSVFGGLLSVIGLYFVSWELFKNRSIAYLTSAVYVAFPFAQVADRIALYDSLSGGLTVWALYFSILLVRNPKLSTAYTLGFSIGFGALNKSTNFFSMYLLPLTLFLFDFKSKNVWGRLIKWGMMVLGAVIVAQIMYGVLRLSPYFHLVEQKNALFIFPFSEWAKHPFDFFVGNLRGLTTWLIEYLTIPFTILIIASFFLGKNIKEKAFMFLYFLLPFMALALFARIIFPRFIFFMTLSLLPLIAFSMYYLSDIVNKRFVSPKLKKYSIFVIFIMFSAYPLFVSYSYAKDPVNAPISNADSIQYVNNWTAGWGIDESVEFFNGQASNQEIFIATEGTFGLMPFALEIYLIDNPNISLKGFWPIENTLPQEVIDASKEKPTYIVFYQPQNVVPPNEANLKLIQKTQMGKSEYYYRVYQVVGFE